MYNKDGTAMMHSDDPLAIPDRNIIISLHPKDFDSKLNPLEGASITQKSQTFVPLVLPVTKGTTVYFLNEDEFFHNIYSLTPGSRFNIGRRPPGSPYPIPIKKLGAIKLSCDIHPHMSGIILSLDTPYFTRVGANGDYKISKLPDGTYDMKIYHPYRRYPAEELVIKNGIKLEKNINLKKP